MIRAVAVIVWIATFVGPNAYAWRSWSVDRTGLSRIRVSLAVVGLALGTLAIIGLITFMFRARVADHAPWFNLQDWGWTVGRISLALSVVALPLTVCARGRTRIFALLADVWTVLLLLAAFASA